MEPLAVIKILLGIIYALGYCLTATLFQYGRVTNTIAPDWTRKGVLITSFVWPLVWIVVTFVFGSFGLYTMFVSLKDWINEEE